MTEITKENAKQQLAALDRMLVGQLRKRYAEVFDEPARSGNRQWLLRRVAAALTRAEAYEAVASGIKSRAE